MKMYHGTTKEIWELIQKEGVLWSIVIGEDKRYTFLTPHYQIAEVFGKTILEIDYENQVDVPVIIHHDPIPIEKVRLYIPGYSEEDHRISKLQINT